MIKLLFDIALWLIAGLWWVTAIRNAIQARRLPSLPLAPSPALPTPRVAVVIASRDDAGHVRQAVESFLSQEQIDLQLIVVDDRSVDRTGEVLRAAAEGDARLTPVRIDTLPDGWLGKCHALHTGAKCADADWILFADADTTLATPDVVRRAVDVARDSGADHVGLFPRLPAQTVPSRALACLFFLGVTDRIRRINLDRPRAYFGVGAFNLVRAETYREFGGHEPLKMEVLDDVHMGLLIKRAGGQSLVLLALDDVATTWGRTLRQTVGVLEKNMFACFQYRVTWLIAAIVAMLSVWSVAAFGPLLWLATGHWAALVAFAGLAAHGVSGMVIARRFRFRKWNGLLAPFMVPVIMYAALRSAFLTIRQRGVHWRDTFYPLADLRAGRFR